ncbi:choice-of-anchor J domain-containing protein [Flavobacterium psychrotrophum]|uniref:choice-of-anchor J domain-containing protein n=1 Tax=Flavobacterium psychrotrophum TaxID=2294119 RepID=UPI000E3246D8|nr:choice-of-anchor J domain-containing protein [Flavobacterium psychrotrophum]
MRKTTYLLLVLFIFSAWSSYGQWSEDFESGIPASWQRFTLLNGTPGTVPSWENATGTTCQGTGAAFVSNALIGAGNTSQTWLVTPQLAIPANAQLSFKGVQTYPAQNGSIYQLWVSQTSATDVSTFTMVRAWTENEMNPGNQLACASQTVSLAAYANQNLYIAFVKRDTQYANVLQGDRFTLDDIRLTGLCLPPTSSSATAPGSDFADINIVGTTGGSWDINLIPGTGQANTNVVTHNGAASPVRVSGLTPSTPYTYYVRANCGTNQSTWIGPYNFTTLQSSTTMPFSDNFESNTVGWTLTNGTQINKWAVGNATNNGGQRSLYVTDDNGVTNNYTATQTAIVHAYRDIQIPATATNVGISFDWKGLGELNDYFYVWAVPTSFTPVAGTGINPLVSGANSRIRIGDSFFNSANYQNYSYMLDATVFRGQTMRLVFEWRNNSITGTQPPASIDNVLVNEVTCPVPSAITYAGVGTTTATINWTETGTAAAWEVLVVPMGSAFPANNTTGAQVTQPTYTATDLAPTSGYDVYVRSVCSPSNKSFWARATTRLITACGVIIPPFTETFNSNSPSEACWTVVDANADNLTWNLNTTYFMYEGDQAASITKYWNSTSNNDWLISPAIQLNGNQRVKFRYRVVSASYPTDMEVLLSTSGAAPANFTNVLMPQQSITNTEYQQKILYLNNYNGVVNIALHVPNVTTNSWTLFVDEFVIEDIPQCAAPTALTASNYDNTTANLSWTAGFNETQWQVAVQPQNSGIPTGNGVLVNTPSYAPTGLNPASLYEYYVRAYCSATNQSEWVGPFVFNTLVCPEANRCNYKVTVTATTGNGTFGRLNFYQNGILVGTVSALSGLVNTGTVAMCPGVPFTVNWDYTNWGTYTAEVLVQDSYDETVYRYVKGVDPIILPITVPVYSGTATCTPVACSKPLSVVMTANTPNSITIDWTESGSATSWEVFAVPTGGAAPDANTAGTVVTAHPYTLADLIPGTRYSFYVRAVCSDTSKSTWTLEKIFSTRITNDECSTAYVLPVSPTGYCDTPYHATLNGATASPQANTCGIAAYANDDVWFEFTATATSHILYINNRAGSSTNLNLSKALYAGGCDALQQLLCVQGNTVAYNTTYFITGTGANNNDVLLNSLTVGTTYKLRIFSNYATANDTRFDICIATPSAAIAIDETTYTPEQLITNVLIDENCAEASNINYFTGTNYGAPHNGIAYFNKNGADFPFERGIILSTGKATNATGPKTTIQSATYMQTTSPYGTLWLGDQDLFNYITATGTSQGLTNFYNATSIEFDFMAYGTEMSFDFLFASEDYGLFQCNWGDAFAFFLTDEAGATRNLAVIPGTDTPVSVTTIRDSKYNYPDATCASDNEESFDKLYDGYKGVSRYAASANFMGNTKPLTVRSAVNPGEHYHIKMVIAEKNDGNYDSAIFLDGDSFNVGRINLGADLLVSANSAVCFGAEKVLNTGLSASYFTFVWTKNGDVITGATAPSYTVTEAGTYAVTATVITSGCTTSDEVEVEFFNNIKTIVHAPADLTLCSSTVNASFNLGLNTTAVLADVATAADYAVSYYETQLLADAGNDADAIADTANYNAINDHTVYVRVENTVTGCYTTYTFKTLVTPNSVAVLEFSYPATCTIATQNPAPVKLAGFAEGGTYSATDANITVDATTGIIDLTATQPGTYQVTYTLATANCVTGGTYNATIVINATTAPAITFSYTDVCELATNALPVLPAGFVTGGTYTSATLTVDAQTGEIDLSSATTGTHQVVYAVVANAANCTAADTFTASIVVTGTTAPAITFSYVDVCALAANALPVLPTGFVTGGTYTSATLTVDAQTGEVDLTGATTGTHQVVYTVAADATNCTAAESFTANIEVTATIAPAITFSYADVCELAANALPQVPVGFTTGGTYASATLTVNAQTGAIDLSNATAGTHQVTYAVTADAATCTAAASYTANIVITAATVPAITFTYTDVCVQASNALPVLSTGFATGGTYASATVTVNAQTGEIDLSTATAGTHQITYTTTADVANCIAGNSYTANIVINNRIVPVTGFTYQADYCNDTATVTPDVATGFTTGGTFTVNSTALTINPATGVINLDNTEAGTYVITYTYTSQNDCEQSGNSSFTLTLSSSLAVNIADSCVNNVKWLEAVPANNSFDAAQVSYLWEDANGNEIGIDSATFNATEYYNDNPNLTFPATITVTVISGRCSVTQDFVIDNVLCEVQKGISPNGDGKNDYLDLRGMNVGKITIFNRYGTKVYEKRNYTNEWTGNTDSGEELPTGTYFYAIEFTGKESKTGWIYINRN